MRRLAVLRLDEATGLLRGPCTFPCVALAAGGGEIVFLVWAPTRERFDVIDDRSELVEEWRSVAASTGIEVRERRSDAMRAHVAFQIPHDGCEDHGTPTPTAEPPVATEHADL